MWERYPWVAWPHMLVRGGWYCPYRGDLAQIELHRQYGPMVLVLPWAMVLVWAEVIA